MAQDVKDSTPPEKQSNRIQTLEMCRMQTESEAKEIGGLSRSPCKYALIFFACARKEEREVRRNFINRINTYETIFTFQLAC